MKKIAILIITITIAQISFSQLNRFPSKKPKLIVQVVIDNFRYDLLYKYYDKLSEKGFKRLMEEGTFCKNSSLNYALTQYAPGYATIATGSQPSVHGIVSNSWYNPIKKIEVKACEDNKVKTVGGKDLKEFKVSAKNYFVSTFTDELKMTYGSKSKVYSVSLDPCAAVLLGGHNADGAFFLDPSTGNFISNSY